jgi:hypothetical protein
MTHDLSLTICKTEYISYKCGNHDIRCNTTTNAQRDYSQEQDKSQGLVCPSDPDWKADTFLILCIVVKCGMSLETVLAVHSHLLLTTYTPAPYHLHVACAHHFLHVHKHGFNRILKMIDHI